MEFAQISVVLSATPEPDPAAELPPVDGGAAPRPTGSSECWSVQAASSTPAASSTAVGPRTASAQAADPVGERAAQPVGAVLGHEVPGREGHLGERRPPPDERAHPPYQQVARIGVH